MTLPANLPAPPPDGFDSGRRRRILISSLIPLAIAGGLWLLGPDSPPSATIPPTQRTLPENRQSTSASVTAAKPDDDELLPDEASADREAGAAAKEGAVKEEGPKDEPVHEKPAQVDSRALQLLGVWEDDYKGKRTMTLNDDGTGTMLVELSGLQATLFAAKLRFDMVWSLDGDVLKKRTVGGEPAGKVGLILKTMGDTAEDSIVELTADRLLLLDKDGKTQYDWRRVAPPD